MKTEKTGTPGPDKQTKSSNQAVTSDMELWNIALDLIVPTPDNKRVHRGDRDPSLLELADSIKNTGGVIEPIIVRPHPTKPGLYDLRAGERRWRAARLAGFEMIAAIVRDLTNEQAYEITVVENLQRDSLSPMEEALQYEDAINKGWTLERLAERSGKSYSYVVRRRQLLSLSSEWKDALSDPNHDARLCPVGHLELIARLPQETQKQFFNMLSRTWNGVNCNGFTVPTLSRLRSMAAQVSNVIAEAPWHKHDAEFMPAATGETLRPCAECKNRSDVQPGLFDDADFDDGQKPKRGARCLLGSCWKAKLEAWKIRQVELAQVKHPDLVLTRGSNIRDDHPLAKKAISEWGMERCKKSEEGAVPCLSLSNDGGVYWARSLSDGSKPKRAAAVTTLQDKRDQLNAVRRRLLAEKLSERLDGIWNGKDIPGHLSAAQKLFMVYSAGLVKFGQPKEPWTLWETCGDVSLEDIEDNLFRRACAQLHGDIKMGLHARRDFPIAEVKAGCALLGENYATLWSDVCETKKEPKSWEKKYGAENAESGTKEKVRDEQRRTQTRKNKKRK